MTRRSQPPVLYRSIVTVDPMVPVEQLDWRIVAAQSKSTDSEVASAACERAIEVRHAPRKNGFIDFD